MSDKPVYAIIGASSGIGAALCRLITSRGSATLAMGAREEGKLHSLGRELGAGMVQTLDARKKEDTESFLKGVKKELGRVDGVVNCAGSILLKPAHRTTDADWDAVMDANLRTAFNTVRAAVGVMRGGPGGSIVLMSSAAARHGFANHEAIAAAKAGVQGLAMSAAASYASWKIRVNTVAPGLVDTPLAAPITGNDAAAKASRDMHAMGRLGQPEDVAAMIALLLDPANDWITGQVFGVDGGLSAVRSRRL